MASTACANASTGLPSPSVPRIVHLSNRPARGRSAGHFQISPTTAAYAAKHGPETQCQGSPPTNQKCVCDERPMTSPRNCLGAHDGRWLGFRDSDKFLHRLLKCRRKHVISISAEAEVPPAEVRGVRATRSTAAKSGQMSIPKP